MSACWRVGNSTTLQEAIMHAPKPESTKTTELGDYKDVFGFYEAGKDRRYNLLFAVNGGVLAIAGLTKGDDVLLDGLPLDVVAVGMAIFTIVMGIDIWVFGTGMRRRGNDLGEGATQGMFSWWGRGVLAGICALIVLAWLLVAAASQA
jgi:hypothetical protein